MPIQRLIDGFKAFREEYYGNRPDFFRGLVERGQSPDVMVIACSDSRVNPSIIAKAEPGELFVVRNVANLVPPYEPDSNYHGTSAAIELAVRDLKVQDIVVLGHSHCAGIKRLCEDEDKFKERHFVNTWMSIIRHADDDRFKGEERLRHVEREAVKKSLNNLLTFPWLNERVENGTLTLHGWLFDLEQGVLRRHAPPDTWGQL